MAKRIKAGVVLAAILFALGLALFRRVVLLLLGLQMAGVRLVEGFKLCLILAIASLLLLFPIDYLWWRLVGWL
jgi:hypothetical protein